MPQDVELREVGVNQVNLIIQTVHHLNGLIVGLK